MPCSGRRRASLLGLWEMGSNRRACWPLGPVSCAQIKLDYRIQRTSKPPKAVQLTRTRSRESQCASWPYHQRWVGSCVSPPPGYDQTLRASCTTKPTRGATMPCSHTLVLPWTARGLPMPVQAKTAPRHRLRRACRERACTPRHTWKRPS